MNALALAPGGVTPISGSLDVPHATAALAEADRLMTVCNSCRYCEGLCAVFPAMEMRRSFADGDLNYIANLCHACGACHVDCQFAPPHAFEVNVPRTLARVRRDSYAQAAWPAGLAPLFERHAVAAAVSVAVCVAAFLIGFVALNDPGALWRAGEGAGSFFRLMPHNAMVALFGAAFLFMIVSIGLSVRALWRGAGPERFGLADIWQATRDAATLRYLDGGGAGCHNADERPVDPRRHAHHLTFYGFMLCFAATSVATLYHYVLGREAPYPWWDLPVVLGSLGGVGLIAGPIALLRAKATRDPMLADPRPAGMEKAFLWMLALTSATGFAVLFLRATPALGVTLAVHLGVVLALFLTMPYGKFVHGFHRFAALTRYAAELRALRTGARQE
ncbi:MAG: tricarballylate utilization 4Fe-4S protein TcuB [Rhizobiales bacterium]|nr:tricarballylate utilization 4Fe-4S protein TcuB [Hyphomicrobiales bacterium]